ncbi:hypothetical protein C0J52_05972 [Blattella germanica]|nr:hypothetical protein C0J52_05972 [Blattella germanica]
MKPLSIFVGICTDTTAEYWYMKNVMRYLSGNVIHRKSMFGWVGQTQICIAHFSLPKGQ